MMFSLPTSVPALKLPARISSYRQLSLRDRTRWLLSRVDGYAQKTLAPEDYLWVTNAAEDWCKAIMQVDAEEVANKGSFALFVAPFQNEKTHPINSYLKRRISVHEVHYGLLSGVKAISFFQPHECLVIGNFWHKQAYGVSRVKQPLVPTPVKEESHTPTGHPKLPEFPYSYSMIMKEKSTLLKRHKKLLKYLDDSADLAFTVSNCFKMGKFAAALCILLYLYAKKKEMKAPKLKKPQIEYVVKEAGVRAKFISKCVNYIALILADEARAKKFCAKEEIKDLNCYAAGHLTTFVTKVDDELKLVSASKKNSESFQILKKVFSSYKREF